MMRSTAEVSVRRYMIEERWRCNRREQDVRKWKWETLEQTSYSLSARTVPDFLSHRRRSKHLSKMYSETQ